MRALLLGLLLLAACGSDDGDVEGVHELRGTVHLGFELTAFQSCGSSTLWWLTYDADTPGRAMLDDAIGEWGAGQPVKSAYVEVRADVSAVGRHGHLGAFEREIQVLDFHTATAGERADCSHPGF